MHKLYVCWGTFMHAPRPGGHPCGNAHEALEAAGIKHEVVMSYGLGVLPDVPFNQTAGRKRAKELTGSSMVPVLETGDGQAISGSQEIIDWAKAQSKTAAAPAAG